MYQCRTASYQNPVGRSIPIHAVFALLILFVCVSVVCLVEAVVVCKALQSIEPPFLNPTLTFSTKTKTFPMVWIVLFVLSFLYWVHIVKAFVSAHFWMQCKHSVFGLLQTGREAVVITPPSCCFIASQTTKSSLLQPWLQSFPCPYTPGVMRDPLEGRHSCKSPLLVCFFLTIT